MKHRFETFGGIIASDDPPFLAFVDRQYMRELGAGESPLWDGADQGVGRLSAPTEVHLAATNACPVKCDHCYMDGGSAAAGEMDQATFERGLQVLADMGVFHVALGGGEALMRKDIFALAQRARQLGLVPNLTVSGYLMTPALAERMTVFGQVNVSVDGAGPMAGVFRAPERFAEADAAIDLLVGAGVPTGINCVIGRRNAPGIADLFAYAKQKGVNEIEFLRLKPVGRGASVYAAERTTYEQNVALTPLLAELSEETGICAKVDCSFVPMMCHHEPPLEVLEATATYGCEAANVLLGIRSDGSVAGCSFLPTQDLSLFDLPDQWDSHPSFEQLRTWTDHAPEPCRSCRYLELCKGGCHAVAAFVSGDLMAPDPDCPRVVDYARQEGP